MHTAPRNRRWLPLILSAALDPLFIASAMPGRGDWADMILPPLSHTLAQRTAKRRLLAKRAHRRNVERRRRYGKVKR